MFVLVRVAEDWHVETDKYTEKGSVQEINVRMRYPGGLQRQCLGMQDGIRKSDLT